MRKKILQNFEISTPENELVADLICGITETRKTSSTSLSSYVIGNAKTSSKQRRIERMYNKGLDNPEGLLEAIQKIFRAKKINLSLDRTNWKHGKSYVNAFAAFGSIGEIGSLVSIKMLDNKGGNSKGRDRIELAKKVVMQYGKDNIENITGDREFFSFEFVSWLHEEGLPYTIRVRENLDFVQGYLSRATKRGETFKNVGIMMPNGNKHYCDLSIKKLEKEYLILASSRIKSPFLAYRKRWQIETFFKMLKTGGFNIEDTKIRHPKRLEILFLLCAIAYLICVKVGHYRHNNVEKIRWKSKDKYYEYSFFRWGLDWLKDLIYQGADVITKLIDQALPCLYL